VSDYIPTTEEVRMYYKHPEGSKIAWFVTPVEFDRWLAEVKAQAWEEGLEAKFKRLEDDDSISLPNPYRGENK